MNLAQTAPAQDTDGDGLLDLIDVNGFDASLAGEVRFQASMIEDLDGMSQLTNAAHIFLSRNRIASIERGDLAGLSNLQTLDLRGNQISSIENMAFDGPSNLRTLNLSDNQLTSIERADFEGLVNLQTLDLSGNQLATIKRADFEGLSNLQTLDLRRVTDSATEIQNGAFEGLRNLQTLGLPGRLIGELHDDLNLTGATFEALGACVPGDPFLLEVDFGFCLNSRSLEGLVLNNAHLSSTAFEAIAGQVASISEASLNGLRFSDDSRPETLGSLLDIETLSFVIVDQELYEQYADDFDTFAGREDLLIVAVGDCNADEQLNAEDLACVWTMAERDAVLDILNSLPGDLDGNGEIEFSDFLTLSGNFGMSPAVYIDGDFDLDSEVGFTDYLILAGNFGLGFDFNTDTAVAVPEPSAIAMVMCIVLVLAGACKRD